MTHLLLDQLILKDISLTIYKKWEQFMSDVSLSKNENMIYIVRGQKVMLDSDLADLYEVETKQLNRGGEKKCN
jgi:hypothetical protein